MIRKKEILTAISALLLLFSSCIKEDIYETAHPEKGQITLVTDWSKKGSGIATPESYTVRVGAYSATLKGERNTLANLFDPGAYHALVFNMPDKITVKGEMATVASASAELIESMPGWLFCGNGDVTLEKDKDYSVTVGMIQQVRELNLLLQPTGGTVNKITSATATLSGVAQSLDMRSGALTTEKSVALTFAKQPDGKYKATLRLLGIASAVPKLTVKIAFTGGAPGDLQQIYDLSAALKTFNTDKHLPLSLEAQVIETPTGAGFTASITDWRIVDSGSGTAD